MGFPSRTSFRAFGGVRGNRLHLTDPTKQLDVSKYNDLQWQVAGMNRLAALATLSVAANGDKLSGGEAWNDLDDPAKRVTITHDTTGEYQITCNAEYPDWSGTNQPVEFHGAIVTPMSATSVRPPTFTLDSATQITVYTWDAAGSAADMAFTIDIK